MTDSPSSAPRGAFLLLQVITIARIPLAIVFLALLVSQREIKEPAPALLILATILLAAGEVTDLLDGQIARRMNLASELGAMLDPLADSISRIIVYWTLAQVGLAWGAVVLVMAVRDVAVSYCRIVFARTGGSAKAKWSGKIKAVVQSAAAFGLLWSPLAAQQWRGWLIGGLSAAVITVTALSSIEYLAAAQRSMRSGQGSSR